MMQEEYKYIRIFNINVLSIDSELLLQKFTHGCIFTPNIDHFVLLQKDRTFYHAYCAAEYVVLDSQVIFLLWKLRGIIFKEKISGSDFFPRFCEYHKNNIESRIFILGGFHEVGVKVQNMLNSMAKREFVVGTYSPPIGFENNEDELHNIVKRINSTNATVLVVGLGTPKQEKWIYLHRAKFDKIRMFLGVGATLDFMSGVQKRAPRILQKLGLEWLFRLIVNPRRLWKRYLFQDMSFFYYLFIDLLGIYKNPFDERKVN